MAVLSVITLPPPATARDFTATDHAATLEEALLLDEVGLGLNFPSRDPHSDLGRVSQSFKDRICDLEPA